jgi:hypothetical protein
VIKVPTSLAMFLGCVFFCHRVGTDKFLCNNNQSEVE